MQPIHEEQPEQTSKASISDLAKPQLCCWPVSDHRCAARAQLSPCKLREEISPHPRHQQAQFLPSIVPDHKNKDLIHSLTSYIPELIRTFIHVDIIEEDIRLSLKKRYIPELLSPGEGIKY